MRIIFLGTPRFAVPTLRLLAAGPHQIAAVVTNPDRPRGRGRRPAAPPVKIAATELDLRVLQPDSIRAPGFAQVLGSLHADLFVVVAFSILPSHLLALPRLGSVNLHPSLLPQYRGAAPIIWAVIRGAERTGVTTFLLNPKVDTGDILLQRAVAIDPDETAGELEARLSEVGARLMADTVHGLASGTIRPRPQPPGESTRAPKLTREDARIHWTNPAVVVHNHVRGTNPVPGAFTTLKGKVLKVHRTEFAPHVPAQSGSPPGTVLLAAPNTGLVVSTGEGALRLTVLQLQGSRRMADSEFLRGHDVVVGERLGAASV